MKLDTTTLGYAMNRARAGIVEDDCGAEHIKSFISWLGAIRDMIKVEELNHLSAHRETNNEPIYTASMEKRVGKVKGHKPIKPSKAELRKFYKNYRAA
jgi:hypothetical protein